MAQYRLTVSVPCSGDADNIRNIIRAIIDQQTFGWQAFVVGDDCPIVQHIIDTQEFAEDQLIVASKGNSLVIENSPIHYGGWGYEIHNINIDRAEGEYIMFLDQEDLILTNHFENYLTFMEANQHLDLSYFDSFLNSLVRFRETKLEQDSISLAEIIIKTKKAKSLPPFWTDWGSDWLFIQSLIESGASFAKAEDYPATYHIMGIPTTI